MAGYTRHDRSSLHPRDQRAWRRAYALAAGATPREAGPIEVQPEMPQLGPYETQYRVQRGYAIEREIIRP
jgi:hypothetical protein